MSDEEGRVEGDLGVVFVFILKPLSGEAHVRSQVPIELRTKPKACMKPYGRPYGEDPW